MNETVRRTQLAAALRRVAEGDRAALRLVYDETAAKLFGVCLRILNDRSEAEDVLQDVYITVWQKARAFDEARASPITWLVAIARNRAIDRLRQVRLLRAASPRSRILLTCRSGDSHLSRPSTSSPGTPGSWRQQTQAMGA